jgi:hypothetical protein
LRINELNEEEGFSKYFVSNLTLSCTEMIGCSISPAPFTSLHWENTSLERGVIAGGMQDGFITLWNPS